MEKYSNNEKVDQRGFEKILPFCIEKEQDVCARWWIDAQNWYRKGLN